jgi:hypothetical protein
VQSLHVIDRIVILDESAEFVFVLGSNNCSHRKSRAEELLVNLHCVVEVARPTLVSALFRRFMNGRHHLVEQILEFFTCRTKFFHLC